MNHPAPAPRIGGMFVNLPVADLPAAVRFFGALGFGFDARFTDATATCMPLGDGMHVMLLTRERFAGFAPREVADPQTSCQVLIALQLPDRDAVDALIARAVAHGGRTFRPAQDLGFMYQHAFCDPDGHTWELFAMDLAAYERMQAEQAGQAGAEVAQ